MKAFFRIIIQIDNDLLSLQSLLIAVLTDMVGVCNYSKILSSDFISKNTIQNTNPILNYLIILKRFHGIVGREV
jgi:hypothetical protein